MAARSCHSSDGTSEAVGCCTRSPCCNEERVRRLAAHRTTSCSGRNRRKGAQGQRLAGAGVRADSGGKCYAALLPCDPLAVGVAGYLQFLAVDTVGADFGISNQLSWTAIAERRERSEVRR